MKNKTKIISSEWESDWIDCIDREESEGIKQSFLEQFEVQGESER